MKLKWYQEVGCWLETIGLILIYGLEGAEKRVATELKELKDRLRRNSQ